MRASPKQLITAASVGFVFKLKSRLKRENSLIFDKCQNRKKTAFIFDLILWPDLTIKPF